MTALNTPDLKPTLLDRAISWINPVAGARRFKARAFMALSGSYIGASFNRRATKEWFTTNNAANEDTLPDLPILRSRSRDLLRNTPLATGAVNTVVENVVGTGLALQPKPDPKVLKLTDDQAAELAENIAREWRLWAESTDCDLTRTQNFYGLQDLACRSALEAGDVFAMLPMVAVKGSPYTTRIQVVEADRVCNPWGVLEGNKADDSKGPVWGGVEVDDNGAPVVYYVRKKHPLSREGWSDRRYERISAFGSKTGRRNVVHVFERKRPGQVRGVPYLAPVVELIKQLDRYSEAEVMAAVVSAMFTVFVKTETGEGLAPATNDEKVKDAELSLGNGAVLDLRPGEDVVIADPKRPNANFDAFVQSVLRQIGVALGIPFEILVKHFTASYSAARAALLEAWKFFRLRRVWMTTMFCQPIYETWFEEAVALGRINAPGFFTDPVLRRAYLQAEWVGDSMPQIDPEKEVNAAKTRLEIGVSDLTAETMGLTGRVWDDVHRQQVRERKLRVADGMIPDPSKPPVLPSGPAQGPDQRPQQNQQDPNKPEGPDQADQKERN